MKKKRSAQFSESFASDRTSIQRDGIESATRAPEDPRRLMLPIALKQPVVFETYQQRIEGSGCETSCLHDVCSGLERCRVLTKQLENPETLLRESRSFDTHTRKST